eukprot:GEMP01010064.1.p1 GENE.GEMP01010064.1~~GEMP01010064.1.p1  ORF type:complete len:313 (+),score=38.82 GEMP01010064.1:1846-2784(+)
MADIYDVWRDNLDSAFGIIADLDERYAFLAIDTEFPGIVLAPAADLPLSQSSMNYLQLRENVNSLKIIQLGLSFSDENGEKPKIHTIQFNFQFNVWEDPCATDSINLLKRAGLDFERHATEGIDVHDFGERLISSGLVLNDDIKWISFHGMYDFAYLLQLLTQTRLPEAPAGFFEALSIYFPCLTDLKYSLRSAFKGGLQALAQSVGAERRGSQHQGGSDALLTTDTFFRLAINGQKTSFDNCLFGLNSEDAFSYESSAVWRQGPRYDYLVWDYHDNVMCSPETVSTVDTDRESQPFIEFTPHGNLELEPEW